MTDTELLNWLEQQAKEGACPGLINDDAGHWAVSFEGMQNIHFGKRTEICTTFIVEPHKWKPTIREAILAAMDDWIYDTTGEKP